MRVLILGVSGMLGHKLWQVHRDRFETWGTTLGTFQELAHFGDLFDQDRVMPYVDVADSDNLIRVINSIKPNVILNAVGIIKQLPSAKDPLISLALNSLFPHRLARLCQLAGIRLIHFSTDCVFSGRKGMYTEDDISDAEDLYGRSKYLGEVTSSSCLTIRTSIIGRELKTSNSLVEWFLSNKGGHVSGYRQAIFSGFPTIVLANIVANIIESNTDLEGLYHVSAEPINKYDLLCLIRDAYHVNVEIEPNDEIGIDRSLDSTRFREKVGYLPPAWPELIETMANDALPYSNWRKLS